MKTSPKRVARAPQASTAPVVDFHGHTYLKDDDSIERLAKAAEAHGVDRVVLLGDVIAFGYHPTFEQVRVINDGTAASVARHPELYVGFCFVNPENDTAATLREIEYRVTKQGFRGVKTEACINSRSSRLDPIMEKARELGVPLLHHSWYKSVPDDPNESNPADIANLASRHPEVTIIMAHLGGARVRGVLDIRPYPNICVDTSGSQPIGGLVEYAVKELGAERVVYGSDVQGRDFSAQMGRVLGSRITESDKRKVRGGNAVRILKL